MSVAVDSAIGLALECLVDLVTETGGIGSAESRVVTVRWCGTANVAGARIA